MRLLCKKQLNTHLIVYLVAIFLQIKNKRLPLHQQIPLASRKISVPSGTFLFMGVRYTNRAITTEQQIDILKERGLLIDDVERAVKALDIISYFRLAGYWRHFEADHTTHQFREGCGST